MNNPGLSIIIVNYNMKELIADCLRSLFSDPPSLEYEVIVVDNDSRDGSVGYLKENFPKAKYIENSDNAGFARACNQGVEASGGRFVLFLNPDTEADAAALEHMARFLEERPEAGIVGCRNVNVDGSIEPSIYYFPTPWRTFVNSFYLYSVFHRLNGYEHKDYGGITAARRVEVISGSCLMARREVLNLVGAFDEEFWMYGEDVELCYRARRAGWEAYYLPEQSIVHKRGTRHLEDDAPHDMERITYNHYKWIFYFFEKHYNPFQRWLGKRFLSFHVSLKLAARKKKLRKGDDSRDNLARIRGLTRVMNEYARRKQPRRDIATDEHR